MGLMQRDLREFKGCWASLSIQDGGSIEGEIREVTKASMQLSPVLVNLRGTTEIVDHIVQVPLDVILALRCFDRSLTETLLAEAKVEYEKEKAAREAQGPPTQRPAASWGNHI